MCAHTDVFAAADSIRLATYSNIMCNTLIINTLPLWLSVTYYQPTVQSCTPWTVQAFLSSILSLIGECLFNSETLAIRLTKGVIYSAQSFLQSLSLVFFPSIKEDLIPGSLSCTVARSEWAGLGGSVQQPISGCSWPPCKDGVEEQSARRDGVLSTLTLRHVWVM